MAADGDKMTIFVSSTDELLANEAIEVSYEQDVREAVLNAISVKSGRSDVADAVFELTVNHGSEPPSDVLTIISCDYQATIVCSATPRTT